MDCDKDDDEIIEEIPIYLSKNLDENLYVLQYPNKKYNNNFDNAEVIKCCVKPMNEIVKIDYGLNTASHNYDAFKGEQFAKSADGQQNRSDHKAAFPSGTMDRQNYISTKPMENVNQYIVGILQDNEIHATALKGILQMRPNFSYFDKDDKRKKDEQKAENDADNLDEEQPIQITVKFARNENERLRKAREKSYNFIKKKNDDEPWCETLYHSRFSTTANMERQKLFASVDQVTGHNLNLSKEEYIDSLIPMERSHKNIEVILPSTVISMNRLKTMQLSNQIEVILKDVKVVTFNKLMGLLHDKSLTSEKVLRTLPQIGILIRGNWVIKSDLLYLENSVSGTNGVCSELMRRARDYVLFQLTKSQYINRKKIIDTTQIPPDEVKEILESVAYYKNKCGWTLLLPPDRAFEEQHQEIKQRQDIYWHAKEDKFNEMESEKFPKRVRKKSVRESKLEK